MKCADEYELVVQKVYQDLLKHDHVEVFHQKEYTRRSSGRPIKIDVSFETEIAGARVLVLVECKHYARSVEVGDIDEFFGKVQDVGAHKGIIVTTIGFQDGAEQAAEGRGIAVALLSDSPVPGELVYLRKRRSTESSEVLRGNIRPWGALKEHRHGVRFESARDLVQAIEESMG